MMNIVDLIILVPIVLRAFVAYRQGIVRTGFYIFKTIVSMVVTFRYYFDFSRVLLKNKWTKSMLELLSRIVLGLFKEANTISTVEVEETIVSLSIVISFILLFLAVRWTLDKLESFIVFVLDIRYINESQQALASTLMVLTQFFIIGFLCLKIGPYIRYYDKLLFSGKLLQSFFLKRFL